ncbi:MAG: membrane protein insertion efficiency factor YidD [Planctomycetota bacterium]
MSVWRRIIGLPAAGMVFMVRIYQVCISPLFPPVCKFTPSCSQYFIEAVRKHGAIVGSIKGFWRILRCNPFSRGGHDPP